MPQEMKALMQEAFEAYMASEAVFMDLRRIYTGNSKITRTPDLVFDYIKKINELQAALTDKNQELIALIHLSEGLNEVLTGALKLIPGLESRQIIRSFTGLRASGSTGDFMIDAPKERPGLLILAGIESPGLTASPAIALEVVEMLREAGLELQERAEYVPLRRGIPRFSQLSPAEQEALIARDPRYGRIICRCETVTEGEVVAACHGAIPARTYDALKRRTRVGTGRCQGGFDLPLVLEIMARELGLSPLEITQKGGASNIVVRRTKEVAE